MAGNKLALDGRVSIKAFILGLSVVLIPLIRTWFGHLDWVFDYLTETPGKIAICVHIAVINGLLLLSYRGPLYKVNTTSAFIHGVSGQKHALRGFGVFLTGVQLCGKAWFHPWT